MVIRRCIPPGLSTKLSGFAVMYLAMVKSVQEDTWGKVAIHVLTECLDGNELPTALFVQRKDGFCEEVVMME